MKIGKIVRGVNQITHKRGITYKAIVLAMRIYCRIILGCTLVACSLAACNINNNSYWLTTDNGYRVFTNNFDTISYHYVWNGDVFDEVIHGDGLLYQYEGVELIDSFLLNSWYGSIATEQVQKSRDGNSVYIGEYDNARNGYGILLKSNDIYCGQFKDGGLCGNARMYRNGRLMYDGEWKHNSFDGEGVYYNSNGKVTRGLWRNGTIIQADILLETKVGCYYGRVTEKGLNGHGTMNFYDGTLYDGNWMNSVPCGYGVAQLTDSSIYKGNWEKGEMSGEGEMFFANGDYYCGQWRNNTFFGYGKYVYADGCVYEGEWKRGKQNGKGEFSSPYVRQYDGSWSEGFIVGDDTITYYNGDKFFGELQENRREGNGIYLYANGNEYYGQFANDSFNGLGILSFADGNRYEGEFAYGHIAGEGTLYYFSSEDTIIITAYWDGTNQFPQKASLLFSNGDLYEGEIINGAPTEKGKWSTINFKDKSIIQKSNDYYKAHQKSIQNVIKWTKYTIQATTIVAAVFFPPIAGVAADLIILEDNVFCTLQDGLETASASVDVYEANEMDYGVTEATIQLVEAGIKLSSDFIPEKKIKVPKKEISKNATKIFVKKAIEGEFTAQLKRLIEEAIEKKWITNRKKSEISNKLNRGERMGLYVTVQFQENVYVKHPQHCQYYKFK